MHTDNGSTGQSHGKTQSIGLEVWSVTKQVIKSSVFILWPQGFEAKCFGFFCIVHLYCFSFVLFDEAMTHLPKWTFKLEPFPSRYLFTTYDHLAVSLYISPTQHFLCYMNPLRLLICIPMSLKLLLCFVFQQHFHFVEILFLMPLPVACGRPVTFLLWLL